MAASLRAMYRADWLVVSCPVVLAHLLDGLPPLAIAEHRNCGFLADPVNFGDEMILMAMTPNYGV